MRDSGERLYGRGAAGRASQGTDRCVWGPTASRRCLSARLHATTTFLHGRAAHSSRFQDGCWLASADYCVIAWQPAGCANRQNASGTAQGIRNKRGVLAQRQTVGDGRRQHVRAPLGRRDGARDSQPAGTELVRSAGRTPPAAWPSLRTVRPCSLTMGRQGCCCTRWTAARTCARRFEAEVHRPRGRVQFGRQVRGGRRQRQRCRGGESTIIVWDATSGEQRRCKIIDPGAGQSTVWRFHPTTRCYVRHVLHHVLPLCRSQR